MPGLDGDCAYVLVAIALKQLGITKTLNEMLQIISVSAFEEVPLNELFFTPSTSAELRKPETPPDSLGF